MIELGAVVLDTDQPDRLADFYAAFLSWTKHRYDQEWVIVSGGEGRTPLVFQYDPDHRRPVWPGTEGEQRQMLHLDFYVDDVAQAVEHALACGAVLAATQLEEDWRVLLDPSGHPFCILPNKPPEK